MSVRLFRVIATIFVVGVLVVIAMTFWCGPVAAGIALAGARWKKWPSVPLKSYFSGPRLTLPIVACAGGVAVQEAAMRIAGSPATAIFAGGVAAACLCVLILIFEEKIMKDIFDLIPQGQRAGFTDFLNHKALVGQHADFSKLDPATVEANLKARIIGQDSTVHACVATAFRRSKLVRPYKPLGVFLFVGQTGSGKTELSKALAQELFGGRMVRIDCNELSEAINVSRLIGSPPGYVGSDKGSDFCHEIGRLGTGVVLFDEIEKAHPAVLKTIMSLLDEARITEQSTSTTYSATGFLIVLTSNARQAEIATIASVADLDETELARKVKDELKASGFLPEVLARIDSIFPFAPLDRTALSRIVGRFLMKFAIDTGVGLVSVDSALLVDLVTRSEQMASYGVREVVRAVENSVVDGLLAVKEDGFTRAAIRVAGDKVLVEGVAADATAASAE